MTLTSLPRARGPRVLAVLALASTLALTGCSGGSGSEDGGKPGGAAGNTDGQRGSAAPSVNPTDDQGASGQTIATAAGQKGLKLVVHEAKRDPGGFVTVRWSVTNGGTESLFVPNLWTGDPVEYNTVANPQVSAVTLVDEKNKKRHYVLRDTGRSCLCSQKIDNLDAGATGNYYAQFPAPPQDVTQTQFNLNLFPPVTVPLSG